MWQYNNRWSTYVTGYNEEEPTDGEGGKVIREKTDDVSLRILVIKEGSMFFWDGDGRYLSDGLLFQISEKELDDKDFDIITGSTHIVKNVITYRVVEQKDYRAFKFTKLIQCRGVKLIDVD